MQPIWFQVIVTAVAAVIAIQAWRTSVAAIHSNYRPVLRPVPLKAPALPHADASKLLLKNYGRGPALGVLLFTDEKDAQFMAELDLVEPLGPRPGGEMTERERVGRRPLRLEPVFKLQPGYTYRLLYQDLGSNWHETLFTISNDGLRFVVRYLGPRSWRSNRRQLPPEAKTRQHVIKAEEAAAEVIDAARPGQD